MTRVQFVCVFAVAALAAVLGGCAAPLNNLESDALLPEIDVVQVKENSDEALKIAQEAKLELEVINTKLTEIDNKLILLEEEASSVSIAKIEELENRMALLVEAYKDLQAQISALEVLPQVKVNKAKPAGSRSATFSPTASSILPTSKEYDTYSAALRVFNGRNYDKSLKMFQQTLEAYPQGTYADNCVYWSGECYYAMGDFASAIAAFEKVSSYPKTNKADDAQLKVGLCYLKMGQYGPAKTAFKTLIDRYPASEYVPRAKTYLAEMK